MNKPKKKYGQNFLKSDAVIDKIIGSINFKDKVVIEIGPGRGALTKRLIKHAKHVYAFEIDESLKGYLNTLENSGNLTVIYKDILTIQLDDFLKENNIGEALLIANIPYYITGPILFLINESVMVKESVIMIQKEVGDRILSKPGNKAYGSLTVLLGVKNDIHRVTNVKNTAFYPAPKVDSVVVKLIKTNKYLDLIKDEENFNEFVKASFMQKRKTLLNNITTYYAINKEEASNKLSHIDSDFSSLERAENLSIERFIAYSNGWYND